MSEKINLLDSNLKKEDQESISSRQIKQGKKSKKRFITYALIFILALLFLFSIKVNNTSRYSTWLDNLPVIGNLRHLARSADNLLKGEDGDRINVLLLGMGGKNHDGGLLTDTIILASIQPSTNKVALISIPRDLSVPLENLGWRKINNINAIAEQQSAGSGGLAACQALSRIFDLPIDYYVRVDFAGFVKIIDDLGGIKVLVDNTLDDYEYPIMGNEDAPYSERYEHLHIDSGWQKMDGQLALKYARSRHAAGIEGSDFARARRQQKIIQAVKDKVMSMHILFKPTLISSIISNIEENFSTNIKIWEMVKFWDMLKDVNSENITTKVLDNSASGLLVDTITSDGAYVLSPRHGDFTEIQYLIKNIFEVAPVGEKVKVNQEKAAVEIRNATWINGLATKVALDLEKYGFKVVRVGNSSQKDFQKSVIYDLTYGSKLESLTVLKNITSANVSLGLPQWLEQELAQELEKEKKLTQPDFILVLGQDADTTKSGAENVVE